MNIHALVTAFEAMRAENRPMALVTVVATEGSTYAKAGHQMLIGADDSYCGLVSGGCLEGDLIERARPVLESGVCREVTYDMRDEEDDALWGLGLGCNGAIRLVMHGLNADNGFEPFATLAAGLAANEPVVWAVLLTDRSRNPAGTTWAVNPVTPVPVGAGDDVDVALARACARRLDASTAGIETVTIGGSTAEVFSARLDPPLRVLVLGAGPDVAPVVQMATILGWQIDVLDHRAQYVDRLRAASASAPVQVALRAPASAGASPEAYDAAIVMSHHLATDAEWLRWLAPSRIPFIGLLGPRDRRRRLLDMLAETATALERRLFGPVGLNIGADGAETIALSICAQIQAQRHKRAGGHLAAPDQAKSL